MWYWKIAKKTHRRKAWGRWHLGYSFSDKCLLDKRNIPGREAVWVKAEWRERAKHACLPLVTFPLLFLQWWKLTLLIHTSSILRPFCVSSTHTHWLWSLPSNMFYLSPVTADLLPCFLQGLQTQFLSMEVHRITKEPSSVKIRAFSTASASFGLL